ncbi:uncharacterized protein N7511_002039 [Penicillium nucicola]|uniref:uncharacterized protein n=1 Tax=Penicillium nucicola TaxID=1850975 RepID=UPI002545826F|nr:uncharacterized protein N7511_002039 [Penicillium nucicola]KAJ5769988.1 hypothetical protein N7511_002039 [Penicillium nucicola]
MYCRRKEATAVTTTPSPPLGDLLAAVQLDDLQEPTDQTDGLAIIADSQYLTSYNWLYSVEHQIFVPNRSVFIYSEPPAWTPPSKHPKLQEDSGQYYRDLNAARSPIYPVDPMIQAVLTDKSEFYLDSLDIVGCSSMMGNLPRFVREQNRPFRMLVGVIGNTVFLIWRENSPTEKIIGVFGYGYAFPEANTT